ncbi:hypothetical protein ACFFNY_16485 [Paenibacillus hodogayensis]|uniref:DUF4340 domain-containing protein n=1 Tax=Paenibacillus hodogayensis TaxID=279208 RepID=A0ABV5VXY7_9BACL
MHRWLLAVTVMTLAIGWTVSRVSESAALQSKMETHTAAERSDITGLPASPLNQPRPYASVPNGTDPFNAQIETWIGTLSAQSEFRDWQGAQWTRYPLGAGMHGWLVLLHKNGKELGYLVVGSAEDGSLRLTEYGAGEQPLFSLQTLYRSLMQAELIDSHTDTTAYNLPLTVERLYYSPLHAVWKVSIKDGWTYIDAKTGEQLPLTAQSFETIQPLQPGPGASALPHLAKSLQLPDFDPFDNTYWITSSPLVISASTDLLAALEAEGLPVTFKANLYGRSVLAPFAVTGYHVWSDQASFIRLDQQGARYVPLDVLTQYGSFHRQRDNGSA